MPVKQKGWKKFLDICRKVKSQEELDELLYLFLTSEERDAIAARVALVAALLNGEKTQREIAKDLEVSIAKITRGSNALKTVSTRLLNFLNRYVKN